jgi:hypothetical protein
MERWEDERQLLLLLQLPNLFEFVCQSNMKRAFAADAVEQQSSLFQRFMSDFFSLKQLPPRVHYVTFVQHQSSLQLVTIPVAAKYIISRESIMPASDVERDISTPYLHRRRMLELSHCPSNSATRRLQN